MHMENTLPFWCFSWRRTLAAVPSCHRQNLLVDLLLENGVTSRLHTSTGTFSVKAALRPPSSSSTSSSSLTSSGGLVLSSTDGEAMTGPNVLPAVTIAWGEITAASVERYRCTPPLVDSDGGGGGAADGDAEGGGTSYAEDDCDGGGRGDVGRCDGEERERAFLCVETTTAAGVMLSGTVHRQCPPPPAEVEVLLLLPCQVSGVFIPSQHSAATMPLPSAHACDSKERCAAIEAYMDGLDGVSVRHAVQCALDSRTWVTRIAAYSKTVEPCMVTGSPGSEPVVEDGASPLPVAPHARLDLGREEALLADQVRQLQEVFRVKEMLVSRLEDELRQSVEVGAKSNDGEGPMGACGSTPLCWERPRDEDSCAPEVSDVEADIDIRGDERPPTAGGAHLALQGEERTDGVCEVGVAKRSPHHQRHADPVFSDPTLHSAIREVVEDAGVEDAGDLAVVSVTFADVLLFDPPQSPLRQDHQRPLRPATTGRTPCSTAAYYRPSASASRSRGDLQQLGRSVRPQARGAVAQGNEEGFLNSGLGPTVEEVGHRSELNTSVVAFLSEFTGANASRQRAQPLGAPRAEPSLKPRRGGCRRPQLGFGSLGSVVRSRQEVEHDPQLARAFEDIHGSTSSDDDSL